MGTVTTMPFYCDAHTALQKLLQEDDVATAALLLNSAGIQKNLFPSLAGNQSREFMALDPLCHWGKGPGLLGSFAVFPVSFD